MDKERNKDYINEQIGARIRTLRKEREWTQEKFSEMTNLSLTTISRLELGKQMVSVNRLLVIAEVLGIGIEEILADFVTKKPDTDEDVELLGLLGKMESQEKLYVKKNVRLFYEYLMRVNQLQETYNNTNSEQELQDEKQETHEE